MARTSRTRRARGLATGSAAALAIIGCPHAATASPSSVDLATSGEAVNYRIPAMTVTKNGTVLAAYDRRNDGPQDLPGDIDTVVRRSADNGATWSEPSAAVDYSGSQGCGDPSLLTDRDTGRVHLFCTFSHGQVGFQDSEPGSADATDPRTVHVRHLTSDDDGRSWSEPTDLNEQVKDPAWAGVFASSGHGVQTSGGRLLQPAVVRDSDGNHHSVNLYSDDHGKTWHAGKLLDAGTDENKAVPLASGQVVQNSRDVDGGRRLLSTSEDGGRQFGSPTPAPDLPDPGVNADEIRVAPEKNDSRLLFSNPADSRERKKLTLRISCDNGDSWSGSSVLHSGPAGYSTMAMLPDGRVGVLAERGDSEPTGKLTFSAVPLGEIGSCADAAP